MISPIKPYVGDFSPTVYIIVIVLHGSLRECLVHFHLLQEPPQPLVLELLLVLEQFLLLEQAPPQVPVLVLEQE
jgi:hypothetical protein